MIATTSHPLSRSLVIFAVAAVFAACTDRAPVAPDRQPATEAQLATLPGTNTDGAIATLQRVTARYHNVDLAIADGFLLLHPCEDRPGEGPVGMLYVHFGRLMDGVIDPSTPDALLYEPRRNGRPRLVGVELAVPYPLWSGEDPPTFLGATFQPEDEFGVFALHVWVWRNNPEGLFAESNPRVSCEA